MIFDRFRTSARKAGAVGHDDFVDGARNDEN